MPVAIRTKIITNTYGAREIGISYGLLYCRAICTADVNSAKPRIIKAREVDSAGGIIPVP